MKNNEEVKGFVEKIRKQAVQANNKSDVSDIINQVKEFGALKYDNTALYLNLFFASILFLFFIMVLTQYIDLYQLLNMRENDNHMIGTIGLGFSVMLLSIPITLLLMRDSSINELSDILIKKAVLFDNNLDLEEITLDNKMGIHALDNRFKEFHRGDYSREIETVYKGHYKGSEHSFDYHFYKFHYVNQRIVVESVSDGKGGMTTRTRTVYDHFNRYGLILPFNFVSNISILDFGLPNTKGIKYKPASNVFNKRFNAITEDNEMVLSKFLKPSVVVAFEDISNSFKGLNFEFNGMAELCMSFEDNDVIMFNREHDLNNPDEFMNEINNPHRLPKLEQALEHIHTLMKYSDNNWRN